MCKCHTETVNPVGKFKVNKSWRLNALFRIEQVIIRAGQEARAKRMGVCGNTIKVLVKQESGMQSVLFEPALRCKDRLCPVCNAFRASILARKVEEIGKKMTNPHMLTLTANQFNRKSLKTAFKNFKHSMTNLKRDKAWFKKYIAGGVEHIEAVWNKKSGWHLHSHMIVDLKVPYQVNNLDATDAGYDVNPIKKELEIVLDRVGLGTVSDIRPVTEGYGKEISKYCTKFGLDIEEERLNEVIVDLKGKRMFSKFGNCYGKDNSDDLTDGEDTLENLTEEERIEYTDLGTIEEVVDRVFRGAEVDTKLFQVVKEAISIGLIEIEYIDLIGEKNVEKSKQHIRWSSSKCT